MDLDKKTIAGAVAAVAVGAIGAAVAYTTLGKSEKGEKRAKPTKGKAKLAQQNQEAAAPTGPINLNQAKPADLMTLKHIGKARAKRILQSRPFRSVDELVSKGLVPEETLARHRDRLTV
ncbi:helix-hairpin-helix domain-containing protein [Azospirillum sp. SYSU D00513]|uniref:ComEA family DNA-binding protein n=1 Tax=Azospirillum sp. SYSU D00513 TaxID=2812561 RepID=UPI001A970E1D|nr:helix-hairpin-helix domain-containing protein [Azospirillum sp. SYSU D00513]